MASFKSVIEVLALLDKSNCQKCMESTCMAFAASVFKGNRPINDCPKVDAKIAAQYEGDVVKESDADELALRIKTLTDQIAQMDLNEAAQRTQGVFDGHKMSLRILGKIFSIDQKGKIYSDIHVNPFVTLPILTYIITCQGRPLTGEWVAMRELKSGKDWDHFFNHQCIVPLKKVADTYTDLFADMVSIYNGKEITHAFQADIDVVLYPLPLVPLLICYWKPEEGMDSNLNVFFDASAEENIGAQGIYALGTGLTRMFQKLAERHGRVTP